MTNGSGTRKQFVRYVIAGIVNTALTYALLVIALNWLEYPVAYSIAYASGIALGYSLQSRFVFRVSLDWGKALRFPFIYIVQYAFGLALLVLMIQVAGMPSRVAALVAVLATVPLGFVLGRSLLAVRTVGGTQRVD